MLQLLGVNAVAVPVPIYVIIAGMQKLSLQQPLQRLDEVLQPGSFCATNRTN
jgi:hypothetical protein